MSMTGSQASGSLESEASTAAATSRVVSPERSCRSFSSLRESKIFTRRLSRPGPTPSGPLSKDHHPPPVEGVVIPGLRELHAGGASVLVDEPLHLLDAVLWKFGQRHPVRESVLYVDNSFVDDSQTRDAHQGAECAGRARRSMARISHHIEFVHCEHLLVALGAHLVDDENPAVLHRHSTQLYEDRQRFPDVMEGLRRRSEVDRPRAEWKARTVTD